jgi:hypothetical protein
MLALEVLAERGIVGGALLLGFLGICVGVGLRERFGRLSAEAKAQVAALVASIAYWFVHSSAEWFWQIPAVTLPAVLYLAVLVAPWRRRSGSPLAGWPARIAGVAAIALVFAAISPLYAADRYLARSYEAISPEEAIASVERAERINPLDPVAHRREAELAAGVGDREREQEALAEAARLDPEHYAAYALFADSYKQDDKLGKAFTLYQQALARNPVSQELNREAIRLAPYASTQSISASLVNGGDQASLRLAKPDLPPESRPETLPTEKTPQGTSGVLYVWTVNVRTGFSASEPVSIAFADANGEIIAVRSTGDEGGRVQPPRSFRLAIQADSGFFQRKGVEPESRLLMAPPLREPSSG